MYAESTFADHHVRLDGRYFGNHEVPVFLSRIIACVEHFEPGDLDHEHGSTEYVSSVIRREAKTSRYNYVLMVVDRDG
jgi:hypothetical protein